ncbi:MFS transporter [Telmatobacter sp. DSM 110680]|uniref:MFS transporter n=1 Tax=Telmatobacter sp. DSM 110680 TaxID=3036704 RepID=A0AAU7DHA2_9BACT
MPLESKPNSVRTLAVLHPVFALTGVLHAVGGALLPSLAVRFRLSDSTSGLLFLLYFAGTSLGALLCRGSYARLMTIGFTGMVLTCLAVAASPRPLLAPAFLLLGISVGVPMSAVTLFIGRNFPERCAPLLTFLNFSWSIGALAAPLIAARILMHYDYRATYIVFSIASAVAAVACGVMLRDLPQAKPETPEALSSGTSFNLVAVFAFAAFLQVGIENTVAAWLPTYALRMAGSGVVFAAISSSFYWAGFLSSRGISSLLLLRVSSITVFRISVTLGIAAALFLEVAPSVPTRNLAMFLLGAALAPTYPLVLAGFFAATQRTADSRWILFTAGFGGSAVPWLAGLVSAQTGSLRTGMLLIPAGLLLMAFVMPGLRPSKAARPKPQLG